MRMLLLLVAVTAATAAQEAQTKPPEPKPEQAAPAELPAQLGPVIRQLKGLFTYQGFQLLDTALVRVREGRDASVSGTLSYGKDQNADYLFRLRSAKLGSEGQYAVVGKTGIEGADRALILVLAAKVVE